MLALRGLIDEDDDEEDDEDDEEPPPPRRALLKEQEEQLAAECRRLSFELHSEINQIAKAKEDAVVGADTLQRWKRQTRAINVVVGKYARASVARIDRLHSEFALMQQAMAADVVDREATHVHTLEVISKIVDERDRATNVSGMTMERVKRVVATVHGGMQALTTDMKEEFFDAETCADASVPLDNE